jgi:hypothetical protein
MKKLLSSSFFILILSSRIISGQMSPVEKGMQAITPDVLKAQLGFLASDWTEGRETGEKGEYLAADYIAGMLQLYGVKPGGDYPQPHGYTNIQKANERTYFQNFILLKTTPGDEQVLKLKETDGNSIKTTEFIFNIDFTLSGRPAEASAEIDAPVIFAGYGFKNDKLGYNDFEKIDLKGKFVLKISGTPGFAKALLSPAELSESANDAEDFIKSAGALGIVEFNPSSVISGYQADKDFLNMSPSENNPRSSRPRSVFSIPGKKSPDTFEKVYVSVKTANKILDGTGFNLDDFIKRSESRDNNPFPAIRGKSILLKATVNTVAVKTRNIIGIIEGTNPDQVIVIGAHYDHLGMRNGYIWNGADDNGSGSVGVMTLAKAFAEAGVKPAKTLVFALWTGEEEGLFGSRYYLDNLPYPVKNLRLNANFDMISRYISDDDPKKVIMTYTEAFPKFRSITEANLQKYGIDLTIEYQASKDPPGGSDHRSFVAAGVPIIRFKPGHREQYHTPADEVSTVNWDIMEKIVRISFADLYELAGSNW